MGYQIQRLDRPIPRGLTVLISFWVLMAFTASANSAGADLELSPISGDIEKPRRHSRLRNPASLDASDAQEIYDIAIRSMAYGYQRSGHPVADAFVDWPRYNRAPYLSATHGNHYVNNYANEAGKAYGLYEEAGSLPEGAVLAKDSFAVTGARGIVLGPLFIMEKMAEGFNSLTGDWKYTEILPDGTVLGETNGEGAERVEYCIGCHAAVQHQDHLYFIPREYRVVVE